MQRQGSGFFIVVEGLDGAGTTTQSHRLAAWLKGRSEGVKLTAEPSAGMVGTQIRAVLRGEHPHCDRLTLALLFAADRLDHLATEITPALDQGKHVVCDRYLLSSLAYQTLDADAAWVESINRYARPPDLSFFLRIDPEIALRRRLGESAGKAELFETLELQRRIAAHYEEAVARLASSHNIVVLDGERPADELGKDIAACTEALLNKRA